MAYVEWAETVARRLLADALPRRWAHTQGVAGVARSLAGILGHDADIVEAAAWLHDIGYSAELAATGFHPLDGARYLRDGESAANLLCRLVAHHSCAVIGAGESGLADDLSSEFPPPPDELLDALTYSDMTTGPDGQSMSVEQRIAEIIGRYGSDHAVSRVISRSAPSLISAVSRVTRKVAGADAAADLCA